MKFEDIKESALMALDTLRSNKLRSALTILGVSVGVVTVIFMVSIIQGLNKAFADQIESLGSNTIFVSKFEPSFGRPPGPEARMKLSESSLSSIAMVLVMRIMGRARGTSLSRIYPYVNSYSGFRSI